MSLQSSISVAAEHVSNRLSAAEFAVAELSARIQQRLNGCGVVSLLAIPGLSPFRGPGGVLNANLASHNRERVSTQAAHG